MNTLTPIQKEIVTALEQMKEKSLITEANLARRFGRMPKSPARIRPESVLKIWKFALSILVKTMGCLTHFILTVRMIF